MENIYFLHTPEDLPYIKGFFAPLCFGRANVWLNSQHPMMVGEVTTRALSKNCKKIITTSAKLLALLLGRPGSIDKYAGSLFHVDGYEILIIDPLDHLVSVPYGKYLCQRFLDKFLDPKKFLPVPEFTFSVFSPADLHKWGYLADYSDFMAIDIETDLVEKGVILTCAITLVSLSALSKEILAHTVVIPLNDIFNVAVLRELLGTNVPKVFQNGKYDNAYFLRYNIKVVNYAFDTINLFHSWLSEMPKDLGLITAFCLRNWIYHKDLAKQAKDDYQFYEYNARDSFSTAMDFLTIINAFPVYAEKNYLMEFPQVFPCLLAEMTGIPINLLEQAILSKKLEDAYEERLRKIRMMVDNKHFNPSSPQQTAALFEILGSGDIAKKDGTGKIPSDKVMQRHPLNKRILTQIKKYREERKRDNAYVGKDIVAFDTRVRYAINPHGTDTGRMASRESQFWYGLQIQNIPREPEPGEPEIKEMFESEPGFFFGEADGEQAEARCTAYNSGDKGLITTVEGTRDYHGVNVERFFGTPYDQVIGSNGKPINAEAKKLRDLSKRTNHGANYNMGPGVMVDTMGIEKIIAAKRILNLPTEYSLKQVAEHLLRSYDSAYPTIRGPFYEKIRNDVTGSRMLVGATGWTRYCFAEPLKSKRAMNMYAAHVNQSLFAMILNKAWLAVFLQVALPNPNDFRLLAQIHDSILFMYRKGREDLAWKVKELMEITVEVTDTFGITRRMLIPCDLKGGDTRWSRIASLSH